MAEVEIVAVSNSTFASSQRFCREHLPHATPFKNWADLVALRELDAVWIGTPPYMHAPVTISALEAGRHVFCQARMAMNLEEALEMQAAARKRPHLVTMLCPPPHGMRGDLLMRKLLADQLIGRPHQVHPVFVGRRMGEMLAAKPLGTGKGGIGNRDNFHFRHGEQRGKMALQNNPPCPDDPDAKFGMHGWDCGESYRPGSKRL